MDPKAVVLVGLAVLIAIFHGSEGQVILTGRCGRQPVTAMRDFDTAQYMGKWYEQKRYFALVEVGQKCVKINYSQLEDGSIRVVSNAISSITGDFISREGVAVIPDPAEPAKQHVTFPVGEASVWVVDTDYQNYSVVHSCRDMGLNIRLVSSWLLSRTPEGYSQETSDTIANVLQRNKIDASHFNDVDQHSCPAAVASFIE